MGGVNIFGGILRSVLRSVFIVTIILIFLTSLSSADISVSIDSDKKTYSPGEIVTFDATVELTECEQVDDVNLDIDNRVHLSCSLPKHYGYYPEYGNCDLDVTVTESNPENCYAYGGGNTIDYEILWNLPEDCINEKEEYTARIIVSSGCKTFTADTEFEVVCVTTTTTTSTTTTTISTATTTTVPTTTTTTTSTTTTTVKKHRRGRGTYPPRKGRVISACYDGIKNYGETDVDCGGPCKPCEDGKSCLTDSDCKSGYCYDNVCRTPTCSDGVKNQNESDVDCGGPCDPCSDGKKCMVDSDCLSGVCYDNVCRTPTCSDGVKNQNESDVDCGGPCKPCGEGKRCLVNSDCLSNYCYENICRIPTCYDEILNQDETDIDCGGPCKPCGEGKRCLVNSDCLSSYCYNNTCKIPTCSDGIQNQGEEGIDCGGPCKPCTPVGVIGYIVAFSRSPGGIVMLFIILFLLALLFFYMHKKRRYVAAMDFLKDIKGDELEDFINKRNPYIVAGTSRKLRRLKKFIDQGKVEIVWIKDWNFVNELISKGLDDNSAESIALAKQLKARLFIKNPEAKRIAEEANIKVYDKL